MNCITEDDLVLYHYRDGLDDARLREIERALAGDATLRAELASIEAALRAADAEPIRAPDAAFEQRMWSRISARVEPVTLRPKRAPVFARPLAIAAMLVLAVALGYFAGRREAPPPQSVAAETPQVSDRILAAYVAKHLQSTEGLLLTAANSDDADVARANRELAAALADSNRLYAAAATRAGNARLAEFLRRLEPVLIDLANQPPDAGIGSGAGLRDYLDQTDLLFEVRATKARIDPAGSHRA